MRYIVDIDALVSCFDLLSTPFVADGRACVYLDDVKEMINRFPKEKEKGLKDNILRTASTENLQEIRNHPDCRPDIAAEIDEILKERG